MTPSSDELRALLVAEARSYIGTKWRHQGRSRTGLDCIGLVTVPARSLGLLEDIEEQNYARVATSRALIEEARRLADEVRLSPGGLGAVPDGDVVVFRDPHFPQHVGMMATRDGFRTLLHASLAHRRVVEEYIAEDHRRRALTTFRLRVFHGKHVLHR